MIFEIVNLSGDFNGIISIWFSSLVLMEKFNRIRNTFLVFRGFFSIKSKRFRNASFIPLPEIFPL